MKIVILGGGFGGVYTLKYLHKFFHTHGLTRISTRINADLKLVLVNKKNYFLFTPLLHEFATGSVSLENLVEPIREIIRCCDYEFIHGEVKRIDLEKKIVELNENKIDYDYLVIALGSKTNFYNIPGAEENSFTLKSLDEAIRLRNHFIHMFEKYADERGLQHGLTRIDIVYADKCVSNTTQMNGDNNISNNPRESAYENNIRVDPRGNQRLSAELTFVIIGGGATGVELAAEMSDYFYKTFSKFYPKEIISKVKIILIEKGNELIPQFSPKLRKIALEVLRKKNVEIILGKGVKKVGKDFIKLDDETIIKTKTVIWTAGVEPNLPEIIGNVEKDSKGRLIVNEYLQVKNYDNVFSIGDVCCFIQNQKPLPQLAQVAVRQAKTVAKNIFNLIQNKPLEKFVYKHQGDLISLGRFFAIGEIKNFTFSGFFTWILWRVVYLSKLISNKDKVKTFTDWLLDFFYPRDITEI
jgi:NADH dehydrogenase